MLVLFTEFGAGPPQVFSYLREIRFLAIVFQNKDEIVYTEALQVDTHPNFLAASVPIYVQFVHRVETVCNFYHTDLDLFERIRTFLAD